MPLKQISSQFGSGGTGLTDGKLREALLQLQSLTTKVADGAAADADITVPGLAAGDVVQSVIAYSGGAPADAGAGTVTATGKLRLVGATTGAKLVVTYYKG